MLTNLDLFSEFSRLVTGIAEWWRWIKDDLRSEAPTSLPSLSSPSLGKKPMGNGYNALQKYARWRELQMGLLKYHITVCFLFVTHKQCALIPYNSFPQLTPASPTFFHGPMQPGSRSLPPQAPKLYREYRTPAVAQKELVEILQLSGPLCGKLSFRHFGSYLRRLLSAFHLRVGKEIRKMNGGESM